MSNFTYAGGLSPAIMFHSDDYISLFVPLFNVAMSLGDLLSLRQLKLPVKNVVAGLKPEEFFLRGSIVEIESISSPQSSIRYA